MQITIEATQAIISSIKRNCSVRLYFLIKESDYFLSEVTLGVSGGTVWGGFRKRENSGGVERKLFPILEL